MATTKKKIAGGRRANNKTPTAAPASHDPLQVTARLYRQMGRLLDQLEDESEDNHVTLKERIAALIAVGRLQTVLMGLRKEKSDAPAAGSTVAKYSTAFKNDARRGEARPGTGRADQSSEPAGANEWWDDADDGDSGDAA